MDPIGPDGAAAGAVFSPASPYRPRWWLHVLLFVLTLGTSTFMGAIYYGWVPIELTSLGWRRLVVHPIFITEGLKFSVPLLAILLCHEMGHYLAARRHGLSCTPPYFIPMPLWLVPFNPGTMGAVIRIKEPITTRRQLLDLGASGPIAGFVVTVLMLLLGLANSESIVVPTSGHLAYFSEPLLFKLLARVVFFPGLAAGEDIYLHPVAWAAWWGLLVTALNLLPFFQLDGGHVAYAMFGSHHRRWARLLLIVLVLLAIFWPGWAIWAALLFFFGPEHPPVLDEGSPLDPRRKAIGWTTIVIFVLSFSVVPIRFW
jgi:membrane-associated protease RseP (regulator of RpoE activity)